VQVVELFKLLDLLRESEVYVDNKNKTIKLKRNNSVVVEVKFSDADVFELVKRALHGGGREA
jgi:hypothetical protein